MKQAIFVVALGVVFGPVAALAQNTSTIHEAHLQALDANKDGTVTRAEYESYMEGAFRQFDNDKDGHVTQVEFGDTITAEQFSTMDTNGDRRIDLQEFMNQVKRDFDAADKTADGSLN